MAVGVPRGLGGALVGRGSPDERRSGAWGTRDIPRCATGPMRGGRHSDFGHPWHSPAQLVEGCTHQSECVRNPHGGHKGNGAMCDTIRVDARDLT